MSSLCTSRGLGLLHFSCIKYPLRPCHYGFRRSLLRNHYLRCAAIGPRFVMFSVYRVLDYPWDVGYILSVEFSGTACSDVLVSFWSERGYLQSVLWGCIRYAGSVAFAVMCCFFAHSQRRRRLVRSIGNRLDQGSEAVSSFLVIMCINGRGVTCTCVALGQSCGYRGTKGATIPNTMIRLPFFQTSRLTLSLLRLRIRPGACR